jgi:hypothetical protein
MFFLFSRDADECLCGPDNKCYGVSRLFFDEQGREHRVNKANKKSNINNNKNNNANKKSNKKEADLAPEAKPPGKECEGDSTRGCSIICM